MKDFFQAASNAAADTVAAPVDLLSMLLGKMGVNVGEAVGGSDWMKRKGLKRDVPQSAQSLAGETVGLLSPVVAAAKAPQIARGLLQAGDNLAAPKTLNPQAGAIVWHGSPHKFDRFDASKIGTGEGAQAYGHGLYLAEAPEVAKQYAEKLSSAGLARHTLTQSAGDMDAAIAAAQQSVQNYKALIASGGGGDPRRAQGMLSLAEKKLADLMNMKAGTLDEAGSLYKVDLPDSAIARMLDWDKPLSQQAHIGNQSALQVVKNPSPAYSDEKWLVTAGSNNLDDAINAFATKREAVEKLGSITGGQFIKSIQNRGARNATDMLRAQGIPGIRYLDGGSRGAGAGTYNYVVFPGEEGLLKILERNGQSLLP